MPGPIRILMLLMIAAVLSAPIGCASGDQSESEPQTTGRLSPGDFHNNAPPAASPSTHQTQSQTAATEPATPENTIAEASSAAAENNTPRPAASKQRESDEPSQYTVDAMVGQVNGKPIYASAIFRGIGEAQLQRLGQSLPRLAFREQAQRLIVTDLKSRVTNAVILAEAERGLSEQEQLGLLGFLKQEREKILANFGAGSAAVAEDKLLEEKGIGIEDELERRRQELLTQKYLREKLYPKVHVTRREVERYYNDHYDEFNPSPTATLRLILARTENKADQIEQALAGGENFDDVAAEYSDFRKQQGGLMQPTQLEGPLAESSLLSWPQLNEKVRKLSEGEHTDRTKIDAGYGWVKLEKLEGGEEKSLQDVYLQIENGLRNRKFSTLSRKYTQQLLENGNYTPVDQMVIALLDVAMARYARPQ